MFRVLCRAGLGLVILFACAFPQFAMGAVSLTDTATISGSVLTSTGASVAGATVSVTGPRDATTKTDAKGYFVLLGEPFGAYKISVTAPGLGTATQQVSVQADITVAIQYRAQATGMRTIAQVSAVSNAVFNVTPTSLTEVSPLQYALEGNTSWLQLLTQIPGISFNGSTGVSGSQQQFADSPIAYEPISIDGALPYETAISLDDMPLLADSGGHGAGSGTNLADYPLDGFEAGDIIRGPGPEAPSIVDSVGGSFVLHPAGIVEHNQYALSLSNDAYGGITTTAFAAVRLGRLSATATYGFVNSPGPTNDLNGFSIIDPLTIDGRFFQCPAAGCGFNPTFSTTTSYGPGQGGGYTGLQAGIVTCCVPHWAGWTQHTMSATLAYQLSNRVTAQVYYSWLSEGDNGNNGQWGVNFVPPAGYTGGLPAGISPMTSVYEPYNNDFIDGTENQSLLEGKVTAQVGAGTLRLAMLSSANIYPENGPPFPPQNFQLYGGGQLCSDTSPNCSTGTYSPVVFNGDTHTIVTQYYPYSCWYDSNGYDLLLSYATPIGNYVQAGASYVRSFATSQYNFNTYDGCLEGTVGSMSEKEVRIFVDGQPTPRTSLDLAWYFVHTDYHYDNFEPPYTDNIQPYSAPRLGFVWRPSPTVAVRAAIGGGFAEATLLDMAGSSTINCDATSCFLSPPDRNLQPEKSFGFLTGTDVRLNRDTMASFDVYRTNLFGQVYHTTTPDGTYLGLPLFLSQHGNISYSRMEGILLSFQHTVAVRGFNWSFGGSLTRGYIVSLAPSFYNGINYPPPFYNPTPCTYCTNLNLVPNINFNGGVGTDGATIPYSQAHVTIGYQWKPLESVELTGTYYGSNNAYLQPAFTEWDGDVSYPFGRDASIFLTLRNITNVYPGAVTVFGPNIIGTPTVAGPPYPNYSDQYGPRSVLLTFQFHAM